jgi:tRNA-dihydrouridine synthase
VVAAGGIHNFELAERVLSEGIGDVVASARQVLADPDWFTKLETGHADEIRLCEFTNYCEGLDQQHKQVTCQLWDREALNAPGVTLSSDGKRRLGSAELDARMTTASIQQDRFVHDRLPPAGEWPEIVPLANVPMTGQLNCVSFLLDRHLENGAGDRPALHWAGGTWTYGNSLPGWPGSRG